MLPAAALLAVGNSALAQGYELDDPAQIAATPHLTRYRAFLPAEKDLSAQMPPPGDQGDAGSCVAWSLGYAVRSYYAHRRNQTPFGGPQTVFSPAYIYNQLTSTPGTCQNGLKLIDALRLLRDHGIATLAEFPYHDNDCSEKPDATVTEHALANVIADFSTVERRADDVKGQIVNNDPVVVGLAVDPKSLSRLRAGQIYDVDSHESKDGHAVAIVGYDDRRQAFKFINSWGRNWADNGFGWISYQAFEADVHYAAVITDSTEPLPPPAPIPGPAPTPNPAPVAGDWKRAVIDAAQNFTCDRLSVVTINDKTALLGFVNKPEDMAAIHVVTDAIPVDQNVVNLVALRPWPQCEAMLTLSDVIADHGMKLETPGHSDENYNAGNILVIKVTTPSFPSYLYVTYIEANGDAVPLYKPPGVVPQALPPNTVVTLGGGSDHRSFTVGAPFGREMVVGVASASPLFTDGLAPGLTDREYLTALRNTLEYKPDPKQPNRVVDGDTVALTTHAPPPPPPPPPP